MSASAKKGAPKGSIALAVSILLALGALGTAAAALLVDPSATMALLAAGACVAFASLVASFVSLRGPRFAPSAAAIVASLCILAGIGVAFGAVSFSRLVEAVTRESDEEREVVDEDFRFRLAPPSAVRFYDRDEARTLHDRALAGAHLSDGVSVLVFVEPTYDLPLADAARAELHDAMGEGITSESPPQATALLDRDAVRIHREDDGTFSELTVVERDGWLYMIDAYAERESAPDGDVWFPAALEGFTLLDGEVDADTHRIAQPSAEGLGYRAEGGTFESGWWGTTVRSEGPWQLDFAEHMPGADHGAIVGLSRRRPDVHLTLTAVMTGGRDPAVVQAELVERLAAVATPVEQPASHHTISGSIRNARTEPSHDVDFSAWRWESGRTQEARIGFVTEGERVFEIMCWSPSRALTDEELGPLLARLEILSDRWMGVMRRELGDAPWRGVGDDWYVRDDTLHVFQEGVSWRRPDPRWRAIAVSSIDDEDLALIDAPILGVRGRITVWDASPLPADTHEEWVRGYAEGLAPELLRVGVRGEPASFGASEGFLSTGIDPGGGYVYAVATTQIDDIGYGVELWASARDAAANADAIRAALLGLRLVENGPTIGFDGEGVWRDPRFGVSFRPPATLSNTQEELTSLPTGPGSLVELAQGANIVGLISAPLDPSTSAETQADHLVRAHFGALLEVEGRWEEHPGTLGGEPCTIRDKPLPFDLGGLTIYRVDHEGALVVLVVNRIGRDLDLETVTRGVAFDP